MQETKMERYERLHGKATYGIAERVETLEANLRLRIEKREACGAQAWSPANASAYDLHVAVENSIRAELADARAALIEVRATAAQIGATI